LQEQNLLRGNDLCLTLWRETGWLRDKTVRNAVLVRIHICQICQIRTIFVLQRCT
jgi:hypothetical protein